MKLNLTERTTRIVLSLKVDAAIELTILIRGHHPSPLQRANLSDFDRFKLRVAKRSRNSMVSVAFKKLKRYASIDGTLYGKKSIRQPKLWKDVSAARQKKKGGAAAPAKAKKKVAAK